MPAVLISQQQLEEHERCELDFPYFADTYCKILSGQDDGGEWVKFTLWPKQLAAAKSLQANRLVCILKARQLGLTWLCLAFALWLMLFHPIAVVLLFSKRDDEARKLKERLKGMYVRLPSWLRCKAIAKDNEHEMELSNGSAAQAFPTTAGDSYTATLAVCDEFDLVEEKGQRQLMGAVKPTIDGGGRMVLLSRPDKRKPASMFKRVYTSAKRGDTGWTPVFLPWNVRPDRTEAWYAAQRADVLARTGSLDDLHEQYPATDVEALSPRTLDKRIPAAWLEACFREQEPLPLPADAPAVPGLAVYKPPASGRLYVMGADPAEGNPTSDESGLEVLDLETGEQVAELAGKIEPGLLGNYADQIGRWYNRAPVLVERNNHGHAVLLWLAQNSVLLRLPGLDGKPGWMSSSLGKVRLYDTAADAFRHGETLLHSLTAFVQLASIEGNTLLAPPGEHDDRADAYALGLQARLVVYGALAAAEG